MEGLEIAEISVLDITNSNLLRIESEFYTAKSFTSNESFTGNEIIELSQYGTSFELNEERKGYPVLRLNEFNSLFIETPSKYCHLLDNESYKALKLMKDDVLVCRTNGNPKLVGKSALVPKNYEFAYASYLFKIRPIQSKINSATLSVYLNSKYGRLEIEKFSMQSNQVNFSPAKFREIKIPKISLDFNKKIEKMVYDSFDLLERSKDNYSSAENHLLSSLGMADYSPSTENINIQSFKASYAQSGRMDAEYYQPKYQQMMAHIKARPHGLLKDLVTINKSIEPGSDAYCEDGEGLPFLRVADYSKYGITPPQQTLSKAFIKAYNAEINTDLPIEKRKPTIDELKPQKDTILFSKDGSVGEAYCLRENADFITSGAVLHLQVKDSTAINPEYLTLALNSRLVKTQAERDAGGSIILHWRVSEIKNVVVPLVDKATQTQIAEKVRESFKLKAESERLLAVAKRAVEIAIEEDEAAGMNYIKENN